MNYLKTLLLPCLLLASLMQFTSCSSDDNDEPASKSARFTGCYANISANDDAHKVTVSSPFNIAVVTYPASNSANVTISDIVISGTRYTIELTDVPMKVESDWISLAKQSISAKTSNGRTMAITQFSLSFKSGAISTPDNKQSTQCLQFRFVADGQSIVEGSSLPAVMYSKASLRGSSADFKGTAVINADFDKSQATLTAYNFRYSASQTAANVEITGVPFTLVGTTATFQYSSSSTPLTVNAISADGTRTQIGTIRTLSGMVKPWSIGSVSFEYVPNDGPAAMVEVSLSTTTAEK